MCIKKVAFFVNCFVCIFCVQEMKSQIEDLEKVSFYFVKKHTNSIMIESYVSSVF